MVWGGVVSGGGGPAWLLKSFLTRGGEQGGLPHPAGSHSSPLPGPHPESFSGLGRLSVLTARQASP